MLDSSSCMLDWRDPTHPCRALCVLESMATFPAHFYNRRLHKKRSDRSVYAHRVHSKFNGRTSRFPPDNSPKKSRAKPGASHPGVRSCRSSNIILNRIYHQPRPISKSLTPSCLAYSEKSSRRPSVSPRHWLRVERRRKEEARTDSVLHSATIVAILHRRYAFHLPSRTLRVL